MGHEYKLSFLFCLLSQGCRNVEDESNKRSLINHRKVNEQKLIEASFPEKFFYFRIFTPTHEKNKDKHISHFNVDVKRFVILITAILMNACHTVIKKSIAFP